MVDPNSNYGSDENSDSEHDLDLLSGGNSAPSAEVERLRQAVKVAGGPSAVTAKTGIKSSTLRRLLNGQEAKRAHLVTIAAAAGIRLEWLATGEGPMHGTRGFADAGAASMSPEGHDLEPEDEVRVTDDGIRIRLREAIEHAGGATALADRLRLPVRDIVRLAAGDLVPRRSAEAISKALEIALTLPDIPAGSAREVTLSLSLQDVTALNALIQRAGGTAVVARALMVPEEELRRLAGGGYAPAQTVRTVDRHLRLPATPPRVEPAAPPTPKPPSIFDAVDFEALVIWMETIEDLQKLGGGSLKSARARLRAAFDAYDRYKSAE